MFVSPCAPSCGFSRELREKQIFRSKCLRWLLADREARVKSEYSFCSLIHARRQFRSIQRCRKLVGESKGSFIPLPRPLDVSAPSSPPRPPASRHLSPHIFTLLTLHITWNSFYLLWCCFIINWALRGLNEDLNLKHFLSTGFYLFFVKCRS